MSVFGLDISYSVRGQRDELALQKMQVAFERAGENLENFGPRVFPKLEQALEAELKAQFSAEGRGPNRGDWPALSARYAEAKRKQHGTQPLLVATGTLRAALTEANSPNALRAESANQFNFGTANVPYASFHQTGTSRMPDRPSFDFGPELEQAVQRVAREAAREAVRDAGVEEFATVGAE